MWYLIGCLFMIGILIGTKGLVKSSTFLMIAMNIILWPVALGKIIAEFKGLEHVEYNSNKRK